MLCGAATPGAPCACAWWMALWGPRLGRRRPRRCLDAALEAGAQLCLEVKPPKWPLRGKVPFHVKGPEDKAGSQGSADTPAPPVPQRMHLCLYSCLGGLVSFFLYWEA